ncbi:MAG: Uma2 family endonuclease [Kofleriaceae bacterium]
MSSPSDQTDDELPDVDERLVAPEARYEIDDGKLVYVAPADEPHGEAHGALAALLRAHCASEYKVAIDMLTRTSRVSDIAPDASVYPAARHPQTGGRQLEEVAFELLATSRLSTAASKADQLARRGVRRVFGVDLVKRRVVEWSRELSSWSILPIIGVIADRVFAAPIPIEGLLDIAANDDLVVRAWRMRGHPEFVAEREQGREQGREEGREEGREKGREEGRERGREDGLRAALLLVMAARFGSLDSELVSRIERANAQALEVWIARAGGAGTLSDVFDESR